MIFKMSYLMNYKCNVFEIWKDYYIATSIPTDDIKLRLPETTVVSVYDNQCIPIKQLFYELYGFTGPALYLKNNDLTWHLKV